VKLTHYCDLSALEPRALEVIGPTTASPIGSLRRRAEGDAAHLIDAG
jgi:hypothetical protein